ncbi:MAG TPA: FeoB small GTPase domain-containing protein, partial [Spirochaetota bacterium]|nr:FeoB small GTPase domain-containing protein [Spirochaetota bacterium]
MKIREITVGLVGNPNCGKTTIFNALTGARQKVANWSGVTVEKREGRLRHGGVSIRVIDLPGIYSLTSYSMEE